VPCHYLYSAGVVSPRERALQAAVDLVAHGGLRALTHARVDVAAGLPRGSTSNYFRTRAALLGGVVDWIVEQEMREVDPALTVTSPEELVEAMGGLVDYVTGPNRTVTTARLILFMEAAHEPRLREAVSRGRATMQAAVEDALSGLGAADPVSGAAAIMACAEGLILHRIVRHDPADVSPAMSVVVTAAVA
jgi:DNA-binding transcriptional regulator YbjK